jgi:uncharacterized zinc-type alcohol dehydrogenase-like protein
MISLFFWYRFIIFPGKEAVPVSDLQIRGYAARAKGERLTPFEAAAPVLRANDVRVSVTHCGVCHTDVHAIDDYYGITKYPFVPGHEIVGHVSEAGPGVTGLRVGDRVAIGWQGRSCKACEWCSKGEEQLCMDIVDSGTWLPHGGFSSSVAVDNRFAYQVPQSMPSEFAAVFMCAGIAVYQALRTHTSGPGQRVGVLGVGGLGHLAIQFARAFGYEVTAISSSPEKREEAIAFGANQFIDTGDRNGLREAEYTFDLLLCTASGGVEWGSVLKTLRKRGNVALVGFPDLNFNSTDLVAHELSISGSFLGNRVAMREMLAFAASHRIAPKVELLPMSQVSEAIQRVRENKARYRIVLLREEL